MNRAACLALAITASASGQVVTTPGITANVSLSWQEDPAFAHNDNGVLEPGEHALMLLSVSFTGQFSQVQFSPPLGAYSSGTIMGFSDALLDLKAPSGDATGLYNNGITSPSSTSTGPNADTSGASGYGVRGGWRFGNASNGTPGPNGFINIQPIDLLSDPSDPSQIVTLNPITNLDRLGWAPNSYAPRTLTFGTGPATVIGSGNGVVLYVTGDATHILSVFLPNSSVTFGQVQIPIAPGPSGAAALLTGLVFASCRRTRPVSR
jgi:hypothetical protein